MQAEKKRILVDIGHPAHVHLFRNAINEWRSRGHSVVITIRDKDITARLLDAYGFSYSIASKARNGFIGLAFELLEHDFGVLKAAIKHHSKILIGTSVAITHVAPLIGAKSILFSEDDASVAKTFVRLSYPFASRIVTPTTLGEDHGRKHVQYEGYQKLAYLNPKYFTPDPAIKEKLGVGQDEQYFLMRFVTLKAAHDIGEFGMDIELQRSLVSFLENYGKVFITSERQLADDLEKYRFNLDPSEIHHALNYAKFFIGDSQSMAVEASILGVPSVRINSFADRCSILQELQNKYELSYAFFPSQRNEIFELLQNWLNNDRLDEEWNNKRAKLLEDKIDVTEWMVDFIEKL
jgi:uncharacterized protein